MDFNFKSTNLDDVFFGAGTVLNTAYNAANMIADGWNSIKSCFDSSRRNLQPPYYGYGYGYGYNYGGYPQPMPYSYGYANYGYPAMPAPPTMGYGNPMGPMNAGGYFGFTDPSYGAYAGDPTNNGMMGMTPNPTTPSGPQGSGWLV